MFQPVDRLRRTFGLKVDTRFVSKLITTQYDDLRFSEDGKRVHPEMEDILQLFGAMEQFAEDANEKLANLDMPGLSVDAQKEMDEVLERVAKMAKRSDGVSEPNMFTKLVTRLSDRSKGSTRERFAAVFKAAVESATAMGNQVRVEKEYLTNFAELEVAMSEGTILSSDVRKRQNLRFEQATVALTAANEALNAANPDSDDYAKVRHEALTAQRAFDLENKRKLFATELNSKMSSAHDFAVTLAMSLAQKTMTKESLWIAITNNLSTNAATFNLAQANVSSLESLNESTRMKAVLDKGNSGVIASIAQMSTDLQKRATMIAHSGGPSGQDLQMLAQSILAGQRELAPLRERLIADGARESERTRQATLTFQRDMRTEVVKGAALALANQKEKRDSLALAHDASNVVDADFTNVDEKVAVAVSGSDNAVSSSAPRRATP
jgi:hypothetical protein